MTQKERPINLCKCPYCNSLNVEPSGRILWHCNTCQKDFEQALVEQEAPKENQRKRR